MNSNGSRAAIYLHVSRDDQYGEPAARPGAYCRASRLEGHGDCASMTGSSAG
jgi:hypothetical protein